MTITTVDGANKLVSDFHTLRTDTSKAATQAQSDFSVATRDRLYGLLASASSTTKALLDLPVDLLAQVCVKYGTKPAGEGENPASPCVRMMFRTKQGGKDVPDKSAWKYGKAIRWALEHNWPLDEKKFVAKMNAFEFEKDGKKLKRMIAVEAAYDAKYGDRDAEFERHENIAAQRWLCAREQAKASFHADLGIEKPEHGQMVGLVAQWDTATSSWQVRDVHAPDHGRAWSLISKQVLARFRQWLDGAALRAGDKLLDNEAPIDPSELMAQLDQHNRTMETREAARHLTEKLAKAISQPVTADREAA